MSPVQWLTTQREAWRNALPCPGGTPITRLEQMSIFPLKRFTKQADMECGAGATPHSRLEKKRMYYHGFDKKFPSGSKYWTVYDDQLIGMLFSKIVNKTMSVEMAGADSEELVDEMVHNLFDLCFYINKDFHDC